MAFTMHSLEDKYSKNVCLFVNLYPRKLINLSRKGLQRNLTIKAIIIKKTLFVSYKQANTKYTTF